MFSIISVLLSITLLILLLSTDILQENTDQPDPQEIQRNKEINQYNMFLLTHQENSDTLKQNH